MIEGYEDYLGIVTKKSWIDLSFIHTAVERLIEAATRHENRLGSRCVVSRRNLQAQQQTRQGSFRRSLPLAPNHDQECPTQQSLQRREEARVGGCNNENLRVDDRRWVYEPQEHKVWYDDRIQGYEETVMGATRKVHYVAGYPNVKTTQGYRGITKRVA